MVNKMQTRPTSTSKQVLNPVSQPARLQQNREAELSKLNEQAVARKKQQAAEKNTQIGINQAKNQAQQAAKAREITANAKNQVINPTVRMPRQLAAPAAKPMAQPMQAQRPQAPAAKPMAQPMGMQKPLARKAGGAVKKTGVAAKKPNVATKKAGGAVKKTKRYV